jgi:hypothetical protein
MHLGPRAPSVAHLLVVSTGAITGAFQCPKIIAPIVKTTVPIPIRMAALFSEMVGFGFITKCNRAVIIRFLIATTDLPGMYYQV